MKSKNKIAFVMEGVSREPKYLENMLSAFFPNQTIECICLPAGRNIYALWKTMEKDDFQTNVIDVLREQSVTIKNQLNGMKQEDFSQVFLFFDYDPQQTSLNPKKDPAPDKVVLKMLKDFNNETENGKLFISYPMVEALRDFQDGNCKPHGPNCKVPLNMVKHYKKNSGRDNKYADTTKFTNETWRLILSVFLARFHCLMGRTEQDSLEYFFTNQSDNLQEIIFQRILAICKISKEVFILSAFPAFLFDYFKKEKWEDPEWRLPPMNWCDNAS